MKGLLRNNFYGIIENVKIAILEPSMGVGNFFGMLPEPMRDSRLYGVELDSITGRIAQQLYPQADIKVAGFETIDRRDFYDLCVGNVPYDAFHARYGTINSSANARVFDEDSSYYLLCSLENVDEDKRLISKADMFTKRTIRPERAHRHRGL